MPNHCVVFGCKATSERNTDRSFHRIPPESKARTKWLKMLNRKNYSPGKYAHVCSFHFAEEDFKIMPTTSKAPPQLQRRKLKKDAVPRFNLRGQQKDQRAFHKSSATSINAREKYDQITDNLSSDTETKENSDTENSTEMAISNNSEDLEQAKKELAELKMENEALRKRIFKWENLSEEDIKTYTELDASVFNTVVAMIERFQPLSYWSGKPVNSITSHNQLKIFLMRLRRDMPYFDLAKRYGVSHTTIQNIFLTYLHAFHQIFFIGCMKNIPFLEKNCGSMPNTFGGISNCRIILDCTEFFIETPRQDLHAASASYSNYKHRLTAKYLIGVAPNGAITFVSNGFPGSTSDKMVTDHSKVITQLKVQFKPLK